RDEAYIGVLIDDLITCGTTEPYRMFTSRAEYRLLLREDNADFRLTPKGRELGLVNEVRWKQFSAKWEAIEKENQRLAQQHTRREQISEEAAMTLLCEPLRREYRLIELLRRPQMSYEKLMQLMGETAAVDSIVAEQITIQAKYAGYIERQQQEISRQQRYEGLQLPLALDYRQIKGLSAEVQEKLARVRPTTLGQAARIPGVTPAAVSLLLVHLKRVSTLKETGT